MHKHLLILSLIICLLWTAAPAGQAATASHTLTVDGYSRTYTVFTPAAYNGKTAVPVVIMLHGAGATGAGVIRETGWDRKAEEAGFIAVFPDAVRANPATPASFIANPQLWNDGSGRSGDRLQGVDDVKFLSLLIADLAKNYAIDRQAIFLTGFSNGASLTFKAAEELPHLFAAIAPVAGPYWPPAKAAAPVRVPTLLIAGADDPFNPPAGGTITLPWGSFSQPPLAATVDGWATRSGCSGLRPAEGPPGVATRLCADDSAAFKVLLVDGLGHLWPGGEAIFPEAYIGKDPGTLNATDVIWNFFAAHRRK